MYPRHSLDRCRAACAVPPERGSGARSRWQRVANTVATERHLVADARLGSLAAAVIALLLRAPFLVVVIVGAAAAAGLRLLGVP